MKKKGDLVSLDDVLDLYLASSEETSKDTLCEMVERYPQYESELRECAEFRKRDEEIPDRAYSDEEEQLLKSRAVSVVQNLLYQKRTEGGAAHPDERAFAPGVSAIALRAGRPAPIATSKAIACPPAVGTAKARAHRHIARAVLAAEIVFQLCNEPTFGRVKHQKILHLCEYIAEIEDIQGEYRRKAAGPLDNKLIYSVEAELKRLKWFDTYKREQFGHGYRALSKAGEHRKYLEGWWPDKQETIASLITMMRFWNTQRCEILSTLYAAWNDLIIWEMETTDDAIIGQVLDRWHESKKQIPEQTWRVAIAWMRRKSLVPTGFGQATTDRG